MQRSSSSIGSLAAALAKAQAELVNPEKSLVATITSETGDAAKRSFRYAPLSSGLDIVRKTLGQPAGCQILLNDQLFATTEGSARTPTSQSSDPRHRLSYTIDFSPNSIVLAPLTTPQCGRTGASLKRTD